MSLSESAKATLEKTRRRSDDGLEQMRELAAEMFGQDDTIIIGVNGSYARREVTQGSDVDLFFLFDTASMGEAHEKQERFREKLKHNGFEMPASDGVFEQPLSVGGLSETIGGQKDDNDQITRRMLLLLEGEWVHNEQDFHASRDRLLSQYVPKTIREDQICLFLLNDIIRYWRTICVDFEHKIQKQSKPRAIRLIKLRFSRMLLFLAGVLAISETHGLPYQEKMEKLKELLSIPAFVRVQKITGDLATPALELYANFLDALDDEETRAALSQVSPYGEETNAFDELREKAHQFRDHLIALLRAQCAEPNPTIPSLML